MLTMREILEWTLTGEQIKQVRSSRSCKCDSDQEMSCECTDKTENNQYNRKK